MNHLNVYSRSFLNQSIVKRQGEIRIGETVQIVNGGNWQDSLADMDADFVLLGIPEDIGVRANHGVGGAQTIWEPALKAFLNIQETASLQGSRIVVLGAIDCAELMTRSAGLDAVSLRTLVSELDERVFPVVQAIAGAGKIPLVVGGGHNNAYPVLKGISKANGKPVNSINLDAHSDYRIIEGRHSGNGFRYAKTEGYLKKYVALGLHHNYNSQNVINDLFADPDILCLFFEDVFLFPGKEFTEAVEQALYFTSGVPTGIELDMDAIQYTLSSAATPCGITALQARQYLTLAARLADIAYLHLTEGSIRLADGRHDPMTAKLVAYLLSDFIRAYAGKT